MKQNRLSPALTRLKSNAAPRLFSLTLFYQGLKQEHMMDFCGRDSFLSLWIINEFLN